MSKKILLVESSLAVRGIAESLLRQNGYEVLAVDGADSAREILHGSKIDLLLVASDVTDKSDHRFYESLGADNSTAVIPLLILHDSTEGELAYPPEAIIDKPFTPSEFLDKVAAFCGQSEQPITTQSSPFSNTGLEDDLIDAALGLDKLDVADSEVLGNDTGVFRTLNKKTTQESMIGYEYKANADDSTVTRRKIDQVNISPAAQEPKPQQPAVKIEKPESKPEGDFLGINDTDQGLVRPVEGMSESSKIEIPTDQFGIITPPAADDHDSGSGTDNHDYDWFINEMKKEGKPKDTNDSGSLPISPASEGMDPTMSPSVPPPPEAPAAADTPAHNEAVDKFISEFKKEMEKISDEAVPDIPVTSIAPEKPAAVAQVEQKSETALKWEDALEKLGPEGILDLSRELIDAVSNKLARQIASRLDPEMVYKLLKECLWESRNK